MLLKVLLVLVLLVPSVAFAAESVPEAEMHERMILATEYHDAVPIREIINRDIENAAKGLSGEDREDFLKFVQLRIDYEKIEAISIKAMAETFRPEELRAMIAYFGSSAGKSAQEKMDGYTLAVAPAIQTAIDGALMDAQFGRKSAP